MQKQHSPTDLARPCGPLFRPNRSATLCAALCMPLLLAIGACASTPPASDGAVAASSGAQTIGPTGLARLLGALAPYQITIQQGNFVSSEMLNMIKVGMTPEQVRFALGTPLLMDLFHGTRWDYIFRLQRGNGEVTTSRVTVFFKDDKVASFEGGNLPTEVDYLARISGLTPEMRDAPTAQPVSAVPAR